jgi:hypothetical protein
VTYYINLPGRNEYEGDGTCCRSGLGSNTLAVFTISILHLQIFYQEVDSCAIKSFTMKIFSSNLALGFLGVLSGAHSYFSVFNDDLKHNSFDCNPVE